MWGKLKDFNYHIASPSTARINNDLHKIGKMENIGTNSSRKVRYHRRSDQADHVWYLFIARPNWFPVLSEN
jgi:hypothetical protein